MSMLILTRRVDEAIMIGDTVEVRVLSVKGNQVRLGIVAPRDVNVVREELLERNDFKEPNCRSEEARL